MLYEVITHGGNNYWKHSTQEYYIYYYNNFNGDGWYEWEIGTVITSYSIHYTKLYELIMDRPIIVRLILCILVKINLTVLILDLKILL